MKRILLVAVLLIGFLFRFWQIDQIPVGFTPDEASFGYDAYSILKTGNDQWGKSFPLVFESFGDYKSPLYTYLTIPSVALLGLNKFSVRLPNALLGTAAIFVVYLLVNEFLSVIIKDRLTVITNKSVDHNYLLAIFSAFILAVSPWHVMMSRGAFEANLTTFFLPLSLLCFFKGLKNSKYLLFSVLFASLNMFTYHSAKFITPVVFTAVFVMFWKDIPKKDKNTLFSILIGTVFFLIFVFSLINGSSTRIKSVSIFNRSLLEASDERIKAIKSGMDPVIARIIYNKYQAGVRHFTVNLLSYYSPQFYFTQGPGEGTYGMIPGRGVLYWIEIVFLISFIKLFLEKRKNKYLWLLVVWYFASAIPAALSIGPGYAANRSESMIPAIHMMMALGAYNIFLKINDIKIRKILILFTGMFYLVFIMYFSLEYFLLSPIKSARPMLWGSLISAEYLARNYTGKNILVSKSLSEPHIYAAFTSEYDPASYQVESKNWNYKKMGLLWVDQMPEYKLGNFTFSDINRKKIEAGDYDVVVGKPEEFNEVITPRHIIHYPDNGEAVYIIEPDNQTNN